MLESNTALNGIMTAVSYWIMMRCSLKNPKVLLCFSYLSSFSHVFADDSVFHTRPAALFGAMSVRAASRFLLTAQFLGISVRAASRFC